MWQTSRWKRLQIAAIAGVGAPLVGVLGRTLRWRVDGADAYGEVLASGRRPIMALWHGRILPATLFFRDRGIVVITSENFDGEWIARIIQRFGYGAARGSSSRGAVRALVQLKRLMAGGKPTAFTLDGPRGPARVAQPGALWLAKATGNPILPFHIEAERYWSVDSWDRTQVPRPFSDVAVAVGAPFYVAPDTDDDALEVRRRDLEQELGRLEQRALELIRDM
jgi:lysophospholipid acyltransferase (LPLAT)-like uncharacterized protein